MKSKKPAILTIAGSDSSGGAGIQADIKTITALKGYAASAITALTAQNTVKVDDILEVPTSFIKNQIEVTLSDIKIDAIKTGMLYSSEIISMLANFIKENKDYKNIPLVCDPVIVATSGDKLVEEKSILESLIKELIPLTYIITPNIPEAEIISGIKIKGEDDMIEAGRIIKNMGAKYVLIKGGHGDKNIVTDILISEDGHKKFESKRIDIKSTHGTGCTLSAAIATFIGQGKDVCDSVKLAREYVYNAILHAQNLGKGATPLNHGWDIE